MKYYFAFIMALLIFSFSFGQNYTQAIGYRGGYTNGITFRKYASDIVFNEMIMKLKRREMNLTFLRIMEEQNPMGYSTKLYLCKGFGGHIGYGYADHFETLRGDIIYDNYEFYPVIGFDAYLGLEYRVEEFPVIVGVNVKPFFEFSTRQIYRLHLFDIAFAIKYRF